MDLREAVQLVSDYEVTIYSDGGLLNVEGDGIVLFSDVTFDDWMGKLDFESEAEMIDYFSNCDWISDFIEYRGLK